MLAQPATNPLNGLDRAAVLLMSLDPGQCANVLRSLPEDEVEMLTARMARMERVAPAQLQQVLQDFHVAAATQDVELVGGLQSVQLILTEAFGREQATKLVDRLSKTLSQDEGDFGNLRRVEPQQLAKFVQDEHPQAIALIIAHLDPSQAAGLLSALPAPLRLSVTRRIAGLGRVSPESVRTVAGVVRQKLKNLGELSREVSGGVRAVADVFNRLDATTCSELLEELEQADPTLFENVRRYMFVFEDLISVDRTAITELIQQVDRQTLVTALKGTSDELRRYVMSCIATRAAELLRDELESSGPVKLKVVDAAQQAVIMAARELEKRGVISLKSSGAEQYVQ
jgi:flagellar motor switch protein FliG